LKVESAKAKGTNYGGVTPVPTCPFSLKNNFLIKNVGWGTEKRPPQIIFANYFMD
jgi:hypothetical protein